MALVRIQDAHLGYEGRTVVAGLDFSIGEGEYLCILGENGSGKSTLMKTMLGLLSPIRGSIQFGDGLTQQEIGYLPQQTQVQKDFPASVREIVRSGCLGRCGLRPFYSHSEKALADQSMERLGITGLAGRCYRELSGGQQQRVLLARALCATRKLLLLDEPVAGLDPRASEDLYQVIRSLNRDSGITVIMISHDLAPAIADASHILRLGSAVPPFYGTKEAYLAAEAARIQQAPTGGDAR